MDINKIENAWDKVRPQLEEIFDNIDIYDMERLSHNFPESLEYLSTTYEEPPLNLLKKISPLFPEELRGLIEQYVAQNLYAWLNVDKD
ncbi:hypothetical protein IM40_09290 (plasmid) [Candidatus Paracaedimonas acanthamoebae]|nr:hypothetical protein IM40_09290 [Candidatus Paracaedimonas acanthamoebae]